MSRNPVAVGLGEGHSTYLLVPSIFTTTFDSLEWRRDVRIGVSTIPACVGGGDKRSKGMHATLRMFLFL